MTKRLFLWQTTKSDILLSFIYLIGDLVVLEVKQHLQDFSQVFSAAKSLHLFLGWGEDCCCFMFIIHLCICMSIGWWRLKIHNIPTEQL